jgi:AGZA family xanthine/uracil permease-like MFS transporter
LINLGLIRFTAIGGINFGETMTADLPEVSETGSYLFGEGNVLPILADINLEILLGLIGLLIMAVLLAKKVKGAILIGIIGTTVLGLIFGKVTLPTTFISMPEHVGKVALKLDILGALKLSAIGAILSFAFVDLFDSLGTLLAVTTEAKLVDEKGRVKNLNKALESDAVATVFGALFGTSTTTSYIESASGVAEGGRTGLTSIFVGLFFILAIFFTPVFAIVPSFATAPALIIVGLFMMASIKKINFRDIGEGFPAFLTIVLMPLSYSISVGIGFGFLGYVLINLLTGNWKRVNITLVIITLIFVITTLVHVI